jgi:hypothetical protein
MRNIFESKQSNKNPEFNPVFQEFISLKEKEFNGNITFEELVKLLSLEFQQFNSNKILVEEEFDPRKELEKVKSTPWEVRGGELAKYKEKFITQKIALAECRIYLERLIRHSPDIDRKYLDKTIQNFKEKYGFSENQLKIFNDLLDKIQEKRKDLKFLRERFPNDAELFKFVTGLEVDPGDKVEVYLDPINFYFRISSSLAYKLMPVKKNFIDSIFWSHTKGFKFNFQNLELDNIKYDVLGIFLPVESEVLDPEAFKRTLKHERQHATNDMLENYFYEAQNPKERHIKIKDLKNKQQIDNFLESAYQGIVDRTQDELTAQLISKTGDERKFLTDFKYGFKTIVGISQFGWGIYNYFKYFEIGDEGYFNDFRDDIWRSKLHFLKERYKQDLERSAKAFWSLIHEGGFSLDQAISLLSDRKLLDWPKEAKRILELQRES